MNARIHLRNLAFNWGGHATTLVVMFFLSPYIVGKLDAISYGIWSLLNVLTGYMGIFDLGVRASVGRHVALYLGKGDEKGVDETIRAGFGFFTLVGGIILVSGIILGWLFPVMFKGTSPEHYHTVRILLPLMVITVWLSVIAAIYSSVLAAHDRFDVARGIDLGVLLIRTTVTILALAMGWDLWGLVLAIIIGNICAVIGNRFFAGKVHRGLRSFPVLYSKERLKELLNYGIAAFISNSAVKIIGQSDLIIVGVFLNVADVREYNVGAMLVYYSATFIGLIGKTFFPTIQRAVSGGTIGEVRHLFYRQLKITICFGLLVYLGFVFFSRPFIYLWMYQGNFGKESVIAAAGVMLVLSLSKFPTLYIHPCINVLSAMGYVGFTARVSMIEAVVNLVLSVLFVSIFHLGIIGVAMGTLIGRILIPTIILPVYLCGKINIKLATFLKYSVAPGILSTGIFSVFCYYSVRFFNPNNWILFFILVFIAVLIWVIIASIFLIPTDIRKKAIGRFKIKL